MSIVDQVQRLVGNGHLSHIEPLDPGVEAARVMVVSEDIRELLNGPWSNSSTMRRAFRLRADLEAFVGGHVLGVSMTPYKHGSSYMGLLDPPAAGIWDIRSRDPTPGLRVFGSFATVDVFVALVWHPRSIEFSGHPPLGDARDLNWETAKLQCEEAWRHLFPRHAPHTGGSIGDFLSANKLLV